MYKQLTAYCNAGTPNSLGGSLWTWGVSQRPSMTMASALPSRHGSARLAPALMAHRSALATISYDLHIHLLECSCLLWEGFALVPSSLQHGKDSGHAV